MRRFYKPLKWSLLGLLGIVGILLVVNGIRVAWAGHRLNEKIAALRAAGEPISLADLAREPIPPEKNAETYLRRAREGLGAIEKQVVDAYEAASKSDQEAFDEGRPTPALLASMRSALAAHPQAIALVEGASNCPDYDPQLDFHADLQPFLEIYFQELRYCRTAFRVANYRVLVELDEGHSEKALQTCLVMFRLTRLLDYNPLILGQLVCIAERGVAVRDTNFVLRSGPLPTSAYATLEDELALHDLVECFRRSLRSDRAYGVQAFPEMAGAIGAPARVMPAFKNDMCDYLDLMAQYIQDAALSSIERNSVDVARGLEQAGPLSVLPTLQATHDAILRIRAELGALRVLNALLAREQGGGTGEPALSDLGLPADAITDPANGEPLQIKKLPTGWLIYSVGSDGKDDGGDLTDNNDVGVGPQPAPSADAIEEAPAP